MHRFSRPAIRVSSQGGARSFTATARASKNVVLVDGVRIPFATASSIYQEYLAVDLQKFAFKVGPQGRWGRSAGADVRLASGLI